MDLRPLVLRDGCRAAASGRVVAADGAVWFDPPLPVPLIRYAPGQEPAPRPSGLGIRVEGVDLLRLHERREKDDALEGWAHLEGVWRHGLLSVDKQSSPRAKPHPFAEWKTPPCPAPPGGWPVGGLDENIDMQLEDADAVNICMFRPSPRQVVAVIASDDPDATLRRLAPLLGDRLCVVRSTWSGELVKKLQDDIADNFEAWTVYLGGGVTTDDRGQAQVAADVVQVLPALCKYAEAVPDGLLQLNVWLTATTRTT